MIILRACNHRNSPYWLLMAGLLTVLCACSPSSTEATQTEVLPTFAGSTATITSIPITAPALEPDRLWKESPFGADSIGVYFYTDNGRRCVRYMTSTKGAQPHSACPTPDQTVIAVQSTEPDSTGTLYSIVAGRALSSKISAVSIELPGGNSTPSFVDDSGFVIILPGTQTAIHVVPIDEHGNLVGSIFSFK